MSKPAGTLTSLSRIARADPGVAADLDAVEEDRVLDQRVGVDPHAGGEDRAVDLAAGDDRALADDRVVRRAPAVGVGVDELRRGHRRLVGVDRPVAVVEVQDRVDGDQVHARLVVGVERPHVAPVGGLLAVLVAERVGEDARVLEHRRDDVLAEVVAARRPSGRRPGTGART